MILLLDSHVIDEAFIGYLIYSIPQMQHTLFVKCYNFLNFESWEIIVILTESGVSPLFNYIYCSCFKNFAFPRNYIEMLLNSHISMCLSECISLFTLCTKVGVELRGSRLMYITVDQIMVLRTQKSAGTLCSLITKITT